MVSPARRFFRSGKLPDQAQNWIPACAGMTSKSPHPAAATPAVNERCHPTGPHPPVVPHGLSPTGRHPSEGWGPVLGSCAADHLQNWIPAFAGMTRAVTPLDVTPAKTPVQFLILPGARCRRPAVFAGQQISQFSTLGKGRRPARALVSATSMHPAARRKKNQAQR